MTERAHPSKDLEISGVEATGLIPAGPALSPET
jgi:hypothetical protein